MIDPRRLRVLRSLADHGTVTAAGAALHLSPSAVSQQLAALEAESGQELLRRKGRRVWLTPAGEVLVEHADSILAELERAEARMAAHAEGAAGRVEVAAFASAITHLVAPAIAALARSAPEVAITVQDAESQRSLSLLLDGAVDLAVIMQFRPLPDTEDRRIARDELYAEPFDVLLPAGHPAAGEDEVAIGRLSDEEWIMPLPDNPCRDVLVRHCENAGFRPRIAHSSDDFRAEAALVAAGVGAALIPRSALHTVPDGAVLRTLEGEAPVRRVFAAVRRGREDHPLIATVRRALREGTVRA
ncbi:LysR family transcriptional regulator [Salininema proteolyticum]|uniref:LysR substrate-binding domain-containing protein n=1 Tax=Salininema proteolyticum TaxID=1607685 RepID=A0ABV8TSS8_9ACTN